MTRPAVGLLYRWYDTDNERKTFEFVGRPVGPYSLFAAARPLTYKCR